jgi:radical SAM superfamily enzyme YgiQ (UPF0313 family)
VPVIAGGVEASLRRLAHYDYWSDTVRRSILLDCKADLVVFGMGEEAIVEIARRLDAGQSVRDLRDMRGVAYALGASEPPPDDALELPSFERVSEGHGGGGRREDSGEREPDLDRGEDLVGLTGQPCEDGAGRRADLESLQLALAQGDERKFGTRESGVDDDEDPDEEQLRPDVGHRRHSIAEQHAPPRPCPEPVFPDPTPKDRLTHPISRVGST